MRFCRWVLCVLPLVAMLLTAGCTGEGARPRTLPGSEALLAALEEGEPAEAFRLMEEGLMEMEDLRMSYTVESTGAFPSHLTGVLDLRAAADTLLTARGSFGGEGMDMMILAQGDSLICRSGAQQTTVSMPPHVREALVIGLTRMGILHNLARLTAAQPPDHGEGGVREWVEAVDVRTPTVPPQEGASSSRSFRFGIRASGQESGNAVLMINATSALPRMRMQEVRFPGGMMTVREEYSWKQ